MRVVREAQRAAESMRIRISYIECHGTGTLLGDAVEVRALTKAFRPVPSGRVLRSGFGKVEHGASGCGGPEWPV